MGVNGMGQAAKVCNQTVLLNMIISIFEMINLARRQGIDDSILLSAFEGSLFDCKAWQIYGHAVISSCKQKLAPICNVMKDLNYINTVGSIYDSKTYITKTSSELVKKIMEKGMGDEDIVSLMKIYSG
jgi:3-hydroxyisobutyrate dehydrogenase-like beta-hydroxyacid dehydrogenase